MKKASKSLESQMVANAEQAWIFISTARCVLIWGMHEWVTYLLVIPLFSPIRCGNQPLLRCCSHKRETRTGQRIQAICWKLGFSFWNWISSFIDILLFHLQITGKLCVYDVGGENWSVFVAEWTYKRARQRKCLYINILHLFQQCTRQINFV